jgi:hypothetical protein
VKLTKHGPQEQSVGQAAPFCLALLPPFVILLAGSDKRYRREPAHHGRLAAPKVTSYRTATGSAILSALKDR